MYHLNILPKLITFGQKEIKSTIEVDSFEKLYRCFKKLKETNKENKANSLNFNPGIFIDTRVINANVSDMTFLVLDIDDEMRINDIIKILNGFNMFIYTTHSHSVEKHKYRVIVNIDKNIKASDYKNFMIGFTTFYGLTVDKACFNLGRGFIIPPSFSKMGYFKGNKIVTDNFIKEGERIEEDEETSRILDKNFRELENGYRSDDSNDKWQSVKYVTKVAQNIIDSEFGSGSGYTTIHKLLWMFEQNNAVEPDIYLPAYIDMCNNKEQLRKYYRKIF